MDHTKLSEVEVISLDSSSDGHSSFGGSSISTFRGSDRRDDDDDGSDGNEGDGGDGSGLGGDVVVEALEDRIQNLEEAIATLKASGRERDAKLDSIEHMIHARKDHGKDKMHAEEAPASRKRGSSNSSARASIPTSTSKNTSPPTKVAPASLPDAPGLTPTSATSLLDSFDFTTRGQIWGTAFASMLIRTAEKYKAQKPCPDLVMDEVAIINRCVMLIDKTTYFGRAIPSQNALISKYMLEIINRTDGLPFFTVREFMGLRIPGVHFLHCQNVLGQMLQRAQGVPEALGHPFSQIVQTVSPPVTEDERSGKWPAYVYVFRNPLPVVKKDAAAWDIWCSTLGSQELSHYGSLVRNGYTRRKAAMTVNSRFPKSD